MADNRQATPGRIVHYYPNGVPPKGFNSAKKMPAIVLDAFDDGQVVNLKVWTHTDDRVETSIRHKSDASDDEAYWRWPINN